MKNLSKSQFTRFMQCAKSLWLYRERKDLQDPTSPEQQAIFDAGTEVGVLAHSWMPGGVLIGADHLHPEEALKETTAAMNAGARVLYEAAFLHDDVLVRVDILVRTGVDNRSGRPVAIWDLHEVKSTTKLEETHLDDVAIQRYVLAGAGLVLGRSHLVHLDSSYVRQGALDLQKLFVAEDVTTQTEGLLDLVPGLVEKMKRIVTTDAPPARDIGVHCTKPHDCDFMGMCWAHVPDYSVWNLAGALGKKKAELWNSGIKTVAEIPANAKLNEYQTIQRLVAQTGKPHIDYPAIRAFLETLVYPLHHLDFEAANPAVPPYDDMRPYMQIPTQASIHIQKEPNAPVEHFEFVGDGLKDPRPELIQFLIKKIGTIGSIIAYYKSYEASILKGLVNYYPVHAPHLGGFEARLLDLADPFRKAWYADARFLGKYSIKNVLPVLVPDMTYANLEIKNGAEAMIAYAEMMRPETTPARRAHLREALKVYCGYDTMAMVRILAHLYETIKVAA